MRECRWAPSVPRTRTSSGHCRISPVSCSSERDSRPSLQSTQTPVPLQRTTTLPSPWINEPRAVRTPTSTSALAASILPAKHALTEL